MPVYVVRVQAAAADARMQAGIVVSKFDTEEEAEYFRSLAQRTRAFRGCWLEVARVEPSSAKLVLMTASGLSGS